MCGLLFLIALRLVLETGAGASADPFALSLQQPVARAIETLGGGKGGAWRGSQFVVETPAILNLLEPQRIVLTADESASLVAVHLQISVEHGEEDRVYERVRRDLIHRFGRPDWERHSVAGAPVPGDRDGEGFVAQWRLKSGHLRAGRPRRVDGRGMIEVAFTLEPIGRAERFWGADDYALD